MKILLSYFSGLIRVTFMLLIIGITYFFGLSKSATAATCPPNFTCLGGCYSVGQCAQNNKTCVLIAQNTYGPGLQDCGSAIVGAINPPQGVGVYNCDTGNCTNIGIFVFISVALRLFTIICGLFILFNFLIAGYTLITSAGNTQKYTDIRERLTFAIIGLVIIVAAYMAAAMIGLIFFGSATFILNPDISQYSALSP